MKKQSKYDEKVDSIENALVLGKTFAFPKQEDILNMSGCCRLPVILPARMHLTACLVFCLVKNFQLKLFGLKSLFTALVGLSKFCFLL